MKKILFLLFLLPLFIMGCSNDNDEESELLNRQKQEIVGTWLVSSYKDRDTGDLWIDIELLKYYYNFKSDGTYETNYIYGNKGKYQITDCYGGFVINGDSTTFIHFNEDYSVIEWNAISDFKLVKQK